MLLEQAGFELNEFNPEFLWKLFTDPIKELFNRANLVEPCLRVSNWKTSRNFPEISVSEAESSTQNRLFFAHQEKFRDCSIF